MVIFDPMKAIKVLSFNHSSSNSHVFYLFVLFPGNNIFLSTGY